MFNIECLTNCKFNYSLALSANEPIGTIKDNGNVISKKCYSIKSDNMALNKVYVNVGHSVSRV